jgi:hypothetical protein
VSDEYQVDIAQSFLALFVEPGHTKPHASRAEIEQRYELCEDMAQMLTPTAQDLLHKLGLAEIEVLDRCLAGLAGEAAMVSRVEAVWVVRRLAELSGWSQPDLDWPENAQALAQT